jgi:hypothetical protein
VGAGSAAVQDEVASDEEEEEEESDDESSQPSPSTSASSVMAAKLKYRELLAKARKHPGGEKRLKWAIVQHASDRMEEYIHDGATDNKRVKAIRDSHEELTQFVSQCGFIC